MFVDKPKPRGFVSDGCTFLFLFYFSLYSLFGDRLEQISIVFL